jgi:hypothetical protein
MPVSSLFFCLVVVRFPFAIRDFELAVGIAYQPDITFR